jgi:predicted P-loop ATPase
MQKKILKVAVNKNCLNKSNPQLVARGWSNVLVNVEWLMGWVQAGYGWCATHFHDKHRKSDNAAGSNLIVIDFDGDTSLQKFWDAPTAKEWCIATYTSASHTDSEHRFRALFPLGKELETTAQHRGAYWLIVNRLLADLGLKELKDNCGQKPERLWYGNQNAVVQYNDGAVVPDFLLTDIDYDEPAEFNSSDCEEIDIRRCKWLLQEFLRPSEDDEYESYYVPVMAACAGVGQVLFDDWVDWVIRGHHGEKEENIRPFKWRGLGKYAGHTKLYSLAKKQDPNWTRQLPPDLRFGAAGGAFGYTEQDPLISFDDVISHAKGENHMEFEPEPLPDATQAPKKRGRPKRSSDDAAKERADDVRKVKEILKGLRKNRLTNAIEYDDPQGRVIQLEGNDLDIMTTKLSCEHGVFIPEPRIKSAIQYAAGKNTYCPITRYLDGCAAHAKPHPDWDRIGEVFLGNKNQLATLALQRTMIGAVARAYKPGVSMSWLPILVGAQGVGKSMFARNLVPDTLFAEISTPLETLMKEQYRLHVAWLLELPEIDNFFSSRNIENFKNLITTRCDEVRRPYASLPERLPRRFVMIGTTNRNQFLVDSTGNRRFVPLEIASGFQIPWKQLIEERDSLWAAAVEAYRSGVGYEFNSGEIAAIAEYIQEFGDPDPWVDKIAAYVVTKPEVTAAEVLTHALELDPRNQSRREGRRVADVLQTMGWRRLVTSRKDSNGKNKSIRIWQRPKDDPIDESHILNDF